MSKCPSCQEEFSEEFKIPKVLPCGHTHCLICLFGIFNNQKAFMCCECRQVICDPHVIKHLPNNYAVLDCIKQLKAQRSMGTYSQLFSSPGRSNHFHDTTHDNTLNFSPDNRQNYSAPFCSIPMTDSFNFDEFRNFLGTSNDNRARNLHKSMTMTSPRGKRSRTPPHKFNNLEIHQSGIFREKAPKQVIDVCNMKLCNNQRVYANGRLQPFCNQHYVQLNSPGISTDSMMNPESLFKFQLTPQGNNSSNYNMSTMANSMIGSNSNSQSTMTPQPRTNNPLNLVAPDNSNKGPHQFGKASALGFMKFYDKTPVPSRDNTSLSNMTNNTANSFFSGMTQPSQNISNDLMNMTLQSMTPANPFPSMPEASTTMAPTPEFNNSYTNSNNSNNNNNCGAGRCVIPGCGNKKLVFKGMTYPFCGRKCWMKWDAMPKNTPTWG